MFGEFLLDAWFFKNIFAIYLNILNHISQHTHLFYGTVQMEHPHGDCGIFNPLGFVR